MKGDATRERIKREAQALFAARGVDGVSIREIVAATGQKNGASLHYYFRTKEMLVRELVLDGAKLIDDRRNAWLDKLEAAGGPGAVREAVEVLVWPSTSLGEGEGREGDYLRFISTLNMQNRELFDDILGDRWNSGYQRCLLHIRRLSVRADPAVLEQRLLFMSLSLRAVMTAREAALAGRPEHPLWSARATVEQLIDSLVAMLAGPSD